MLEEQFIVQTEAGEIFHTSVFTLSTEVPLCPTGAAGESVSLSIHSPDWRSYQADKGETPVGMYCGQASSIVP